MAGHGLKAPAISKRLTAISVLHKAAGLGSPTLHERVKDVFEGTRREHGSLEKGAAPLLTPTIKHVRPTRRARDKNALPYGSTRRHAQSGT